MLQVQNSPTTSITTELQAFLEFTPCNLSLFDLIQTELASASEVFKRYNHHSTQDSIARNISIFADAIKLSSLISKTIQASSSVLNQIDVKYNPERIMIETLKNPILNPTESQTAVLKLLKAASYAQVTDNTIKYKILLGMEDHELQDPEITRLREKQLLSSFMSNPSLETFEENIYKNLKSLFRVTDAELKDPVNATYQKIQATLHLTDEQMTSPKTMQTKIMGALLGLTDSQMQNPIAVRCKTIQYLLGLTDAEMRTSEKTQAILGFNNAQMKQFLKERDQTFRFLLGLTGENLPEGSQTRTMNGLLAMLANLDKQKKQLDQVTKTLEALPYSSMIITVQNFLASVNCNSSLFDLVEKTLASSSEILERDKDVSIQDISSLVINIKTLSSLISKIIQTNTSVLDQIDAKYHPEHRVISTLTNPGLNPKESKNIISKATILILLGCSFAQVLQSNPIKYELLLGLSDYELFNPLLIKDKTRKLLSSFILDPSLETFKKDITTNLKSLLKVTDAELTNPQNEKYQIIQSTLRLTDDQMASLEIIQSKIMGGIFNLTDSQMQDPGIVRYKTIQYLLGLTDAQMGNWPTLNSALIEAAATEETELEKEKNQIFSFLLGLTKENLSKGASNRTMKTLNTMLRDLVQQKTQLNYLARVLQNKKNS